jgi:hypothetical protein
MKQTFVKLFGLMIVALCLTGGAYAQNASAIMADIPFEFSIGNKAFPAGQYQVTQVTPLTLALRDSQYRFVSLFRTGTAQTLAPYSKPVFLFDREGDRYTLTQIWDAGSTTGYELPLSRRTVAIQGHLADAR